MRGWPESPESLARGMLSKGFPVNPGELPTSPEQWVRLRPTQTEPGLVGHEGFPAGSEQALNAEQPVAKGDRRRQLRVDEQSYKSMVPMKVENRRAPARGGHGIHWREGADR